MVLAKKDDKQVCVFDALPRAGGGLAPLTLASHPGLCLAKAHTDVRQAGEWSYMELCVSDARAAAAQGLLVNAKMAGKFIVTEDGFVLDVAYWSYHERNTVNLVRHAHGRDDKTYATNRDGSGGRNFVVNADGTVTPEAAAHFALGCQFAPALPQVVPIEGVAYAQPVAEAFGEGGPIEGVVVGVALAPAYKTPY